MAAKFIKFVKSVGVTAVGTAKADLAESNKTNKSPRSIAAGAVTDATVLVDDAWNAIEVRPPPPPAAAFLIPPPWISGECVKRDRAKVGTIIPDIELNACYAFGDDRRRGRAYALRDINFWLALNPDRHGTPAITPAIAPRSTPRI